MAATPTIPGVHVFERPSGVHTISSVATSVTAFVGSSTRGPINQPEIFFDLAGFESIFGEVRDIPGELGLQVRQFYQNGGGTAWAIRVANNAISSSLMLLPEAGANGGAVDAVLGVSARDAGQLGNQIQVDVDYDTPSPETTFNLTVYRRLIDSAGNELVEEEELFENLTMDPDHGRFVETIVNSSSELVRVESLVDYTALASDGISIAGVIVGTADPVLAVHQTFPAPDQGSFSIEVDGQRPIVVTVQMPSTATVAQLEAAFTDAITDRLNAEGLSGGVSVALRPDTVASGSVAGGRLLAFTSPGGTVRLSAAPSQDIAVPLQLGAGQGGLEADRFSTVRPAPTGLTARLHDNAAANDLLQLRTLAGEDKSTLTDWTLTTPDGSPTDSIAFSGGPLYEGTVDPFTSADPIVGSFRNVIANLAALAASISGSPGIQQSAQVDGLRLAVTGPDRAPLGTTGLQLSSVTLPIEDTLFLAAESPANVAAYPLGDTTGGVYHTGGAAGSDGATPQAGDYADAYDALARAADIFNLLVLPRTRVSGAEQTDAQRASLWGQASTFCRDNRAFLIVDPPSENGAWSEVGEVIDPVAGVDSMRIGLVSDHAALYWPRVRITDDAGTDRHIDPAGSMAGIYARTDSNRGVWSAPAGMRATISSVRGLEHVITDPENGQTNPVAVDTLRLFSSGVTVWGARTLDGFDGSANSDWRYVPVRRTALLIEESLYRGLKFAVFQPNDEPLWAQIRLAAGAFMNNLFRQGAFQGRKSSDAYYVRCDSRTTSQNAINLGVVNVEVGFAALKPAEFVIVYVQQMAGQVQT